MTQLEMDAQSWPLLAPLDQQVRVRGVVLNRPVCVVGRAYVHLPLPSDEISRAHALLVNDGASVYVRDLASKNGVYRNGEPVREAKLRREDVVGFGTIRFRCESGFEENGVTTDETSSSTTARLLLDGTTLSLPFSQRTFLIGTRESCDAPLRGIGVSPVHAVIFRRNNQHFVRDLNSENGTFVNGRRTREAKLDSNDQIRTGTVTLRYEIDESLASHIDEMRAVGSTDLGTDRVEVPSHWAYNGDQVEALKSGVSGHLRNDHADNSSTNGNPLASADGQIRVWDVIDSEGDVVEEANAARSLDFDLVKTEPVFEGKSEDASLEVVDHRKPPDADPEEQFAESTYGASSNSLDDISTPPGLDGWDDDDHAEMSGPLQSHRNGTVREDGATDSDIEASGETADLGRLEEERRVRKLLGRLSRNVSGLKSAWSTLYASHGRDGDPHDKNHPSN